MAAIACRSSSMTGNGAAGFSTAMVGSLAGATGGSRRVRARERVVVGAGAAAPLRRVGGCGGGAGGRSAAEGEEDAAGVVGSEAREARRNLRARRVGPAYAVTAGDGIGELAGRLGPFAAGFEDLYTDGAAGLVQRDAHLLERPEV